ncbi:MAG: hypothetical protein WBM69_10775 [Desulfobacterales bacterium]
MGRVVKKNDLGFGHQGPRQGHALLLSAAAFGRRAVVEPVKLNEAQHPGHLLPDFIPWHFSVLQGVGDVIEHVHVRPDRVGLENHA